MRISKTLFALLAVAGTAQAAQLTLYKQPNFVGGDLTLRNETNDLDGAGFQDQASSVVVQSGRWQVCTQPNFQGECTTLDRGRYASLDPALNHRIESARPLGAYARNDRGHRYADRDYDRRIYGYDDQRYEDTGPRRNWHDLDSGPRYDNAPRDFPNGYGSDNDRYQGR